MPSAPSASTAQRLRLATDRLPEKKMVAMFEVGRHFLEEAHLLSGEQHLDPAMVLITATVSVGTVERSMRDALTRRTGSRSGACAEPVVRPMSRRAIAVATGLPRETVRRRVKRLVELGVLHEDSRGVVCAEANHSPEAMTRISRVLAHQAAMTNILLAEGIFEIEPHAA